MRAAAALLAALLVTFIAVPATATSIVVDLAELERPMPPSASDWSVADVEFWMNRTIGYPEYAAVVRANVVDGPTLLRLDVDKAFAPTHYIHGVKLRAHIDILRGRCACPQNPTDLWSYLSVHSEFALRLGSTLLFTPRAGLLYIFAMDTATYNALMAPAVDLETELLAVDRDGAAESLVPWYTSALYLTLTVAMPYVVLGYKVLSYWTLNYFVLTPVLLFLVLEQLSEYLGLLTAFRLVRSGSIPLKAALRNLLRYTMAVPLIANILAFVLPSAAVYLFVVLFLLHAGLICFTTLVGVFHGVTGPTEKAE